MVIVNRWGQIVYETDDYTKGWNGKYNDKNALGGTYFFKAVYSTPTDDYEEKGALELVK